MSTVTRISLERRSAEPTNSSSQSFPSFMIGRPHHKLSTGRTHPAQRSRTTTSRITGRHQPSIFSHRVSLFGLRQKAIYKSEKLKTKTNQCVKDVPIHRDSTLPQNRSRGAHFCTQSKRSTLSNNGDGVTTETGRAEDTQITWDA